LVQKIGQSTSLFFILGIKSRYVSGWMQLLQASSRNCAVGERMALLGAQPCIIRFGPLEDDSFNLELRKRGSIVKLPRQQFALLLMLTERAGQILSRDEIHQRIWGPDTFVDFERGIH
jgi:DNA-binding response OmpR family regulator